MRRFHGRTLLSLVGLFALLSVGSQFAQAAGIDRHIEFDGEFSQAIELAAGEVIEVSVGVISPSKMPSNGRFVVQWSAPTKDARWRKVIHALDTDLSVAYRAPKQGQYQLSLSAAQDV